MFSEGGGNLFDSAINFIVFTIVLFIAVWIWVKFIESKVGKILKYNTFDKIAVWYDGLSYKSQSIVSKVSFALYIIAVFSFLFYI